MNRGHIVIAAGGGGVPVVVPEEGELRGVEAVIDKDYAASMLAASLSADLFVILTGVDRVSTRLREADAKLRSRGSTWPPPAPFLRRASFHPAAWDPRSTRRFDSSRPAAGKC